MRELGGRLLRTLYLGILWHRPATCRWTSLTDGGYLVDLQLSSIDYTRPWLGFCLRGYLGHVEDHGSERSFYSVSERVDKVFDEEGADPMTPTDVRDIVERMQTWGDSVTQQHE